MKLEWSGAALSDLDRFASFLHDRFPKLAGAIAQTILDKPKYSRLIRTSGTHWQAARIFDRSSCVL
jgi:hypothetical protein